MLGPKSLRSVNATIKNTLKNVPIVVGQETFNKKQQQLSLGVVVVVLGGATSASGGGGIGIGDGGWGYAIK